MEEKTQSPDTSAWNILLPNKKKKFSDWLVILIKEQCKKNEIC